MNEIETDEFERELKRLVPADAPETMVDGLVAALSRESCRGRLERPANLSWAGWQWLRLLVPASALAGLMALASFEIRWAGPNRFAAVGPGNGGGPGMVLKADRVEIERDLVASFDAVARMPNGEPVRFRCREWKDNVVVRDSVRGVIVERGGPRLEILPVGFETY